MSETVDNSTDLIERLRHADQHSQQRILGSRIFGEAADALSAKDRDLAEAQRPEVRCDGCGSSWTEADLARERAANPNLLSCCPERKPLTIDQWKARADEALSALREKDLDLAGTWKAVLHVFGPEGCSKVGEAFPDGRKYVEDIRELTAPDTKKENGQ